MRCYFATTIDRLVHARAPSVHVLHPQNTFRAVSSRVRACDSMLPSTVARETSILCRVVRPGRCWHQARARQTSKSPSPSFALSARFGCWRERSALGAAELELHLPCSPADLRRPSVARLRDSCSAPMEAAAARARRKAATVADPLPPRQPRRGVRRFRASTRVGTPSARAGPEPTVDGAQRERPSQSIFVL